LIVKTQENSPAEAVIKKIFEVSFAEPIRLSWRIRNPGCQTGIRQMGQGLWRLGGLMSDRQRDINPIVRRKQT